MLDGTTGRGWSAGPAYSVAAAGDVDGDRRTDVVVGGVAGDLDRDGALDVELAAYVIRERPDGEETVRVARAAESLRTGRWFPGGPYWYGIGLTVDGRGDDVQELAADRPSLLRVLRGATGRPMWSAGYGGALPPPVTSRLLHRCAGQPASSSSRRS